MEAMFKLAADKEKFEFLQKVDIDEKGQPVEKKELIRRKRWITKKEADGTLKKIEENWDRRKDDFENTGTKLLEIFVKLPIRGEMLKKVGGPVLILIMLWLISNVIGGYKGASDGK